MKNKIFTLLLALIASIGMTNAEIFKVGDLYYQDSVRTRIMPPAKIVYDTVFLGIVSSPEYDRYAGDIVIPESVEHNGNTFDITSINGRVFADCTGLTSVDIPNSVTSIEAGAFRGCTGLTSVTIPNSVTSIRTYAFSGCSSLTSVNFSNNITSIEEGAFNGCSSLTSITIPNSITTISEWVFSACIGLTSVTIPNSVTNIGNHAFVSCNLTSVDIPGSVTNIGDGAFNNCAGLVSIYVSEENQYYCSVNNVLFNKNRTMLIQYPCGVQGEYSIPDGVTGIGYGAFATCSGLTAVSIPNSVTSIGFFAFGACSGLNSITCEAVTPPTLGGSVFEYVNKSIPLYVPAESITAYQAVDQWKEFNIRAIGDETNFYISPSVYWKIQGDTLIVDGSGVIPDYTPGSAPWESHVSEINVIYIEDGITRIGEWAFGNMSATTVRIPQTVSVIGADAFKGTTTINSVYYDGYTNQWSTIDFVNEYSNPLFYGATLYSKGEPVTTIVVPSTITEISTNSFVGISTVEVNSIEEWCNVTITSSDYTPSYELTINGVPVTEVCLPEGVTHINANAFNGCTSIRKVCIPASMQQIGADAFNGTVNLQKVTYAGTLAQWCQITFADAEANPSCHANLYFGEEIVGTRLDIPASLTTINAFVFPNPRMMEVHFAALDPSGYMLNSFGTPEAVGNKHFYVPCGTSPAYHTQLNYTESMFTENCSSSESFTVIFLDWNGSQLSIQEIEEGHSAVAPEEPVRDGYVFAGWGSDFTHITANTFVVAQYTAQQTTLIPVYFVDAEGEQVMVSYVADPAPMAPFVEGRAFIGWITESANLQQGITIRATYDLEPTHIDQVNSDPANMRKIIDGGHVYILRGDKTYTLTGQEVR